MLINIKHSRLAIRLHEGSIGRRHSRLRVDADLDADAIQYGGGRRSCA